MAYLRQSCGTYKTVKFRSEAAPDDVGEHGEEREGLGDDREEVGHGDEHPVFTLEVPQLVRNHLITAV